MLLFLYNKDGAILLFMDNKNSGKLLFIENSMYLCEKKQDGRVIFSIYKAA